MGALDGIRVVDFGQYIAGPLLGMLLADQGADVIRVDPPTGPILRLDANAMWNRGKRSIVLDLKQPGDADRARRLVASADVAIENCRPGVMSRLGLGADELCTSNPALVHCSMPGFSVDDPRRNLPGWEGIVSAATATYAATGLLGDGGGGAFRPRYTAIPTASAYAAFQAATAIGMALLARERDGLGQQIEVSLFDAMFGALGFRGQRPFQLRGLAGLRTSQFECADGRWIQFHSGNKNVPDFMEAAGISDWAEEGLLDADRRASDPDLVRELDRRMVELFLTRTAFEWEELIARAGSEATVCRTSAEWIEHPHALESHAIVTVPNAELGDTRQPGINVRLSATPGAIRSGAPVLDGDRETILRELEELDTTRENSAPAGHGEQGAGVAEDAGVLRALDGVTVLDLCVVLAGPTCGRTLAEYGAHVIKIDSPTRNEAIVFHNDVNRGKHSILLDLKSEDGQEIFWELVDRADVIVQNFRLGVAETLGVGYEQVRARRPDIVYASLNSYGFEGPWAPRPGHEQLAQAATGMQVRFGGDGPPVLQTNAVNDYGTGFMGAYGIAMALRHRMRTGVGQHVDSALAYTAVTLQSPFMVQHASSAPGGEARGQEALGDAPLHRAYRAADGWLFVGAGRDRIARLADVPGLEGITLTDNEDDDAGLERELETRFAGADIATWCDRLAGVGIASTRVLESPNELIDDPLVRQRGLIVEREHEGIGPLTTTGPGVRLSRTPVHAGRPAPRPGSDAASILDEIGRASDLDRLVAAGIVRLDGVVGL